MAVDKLVDSSQLDTDLASVANAIRTKGGTSALLAFPADFVTAIGAISGGDQSVEAALISGNITGAYTNNLVTKVGSAMLRNRMFSSVSFPNCIEINDSSFRYCDNLESVYLPLAALTGNGQNYVFGNCPKLKKIALPSLTQTTSLFFQNDTLLEEVDFGQNLAGMTNQTFASCPALSVLVLRKSSGIVALGNVNVFNGTPFASGGTGGMIYIPKALYDHLGDNSSLDYKAASNWATIQGYGTITWAKIEGSYYETHYADGTAV